MGASGCGDLWVWGYRGLRWDHGCSSMGVAPKCGLRQYEASVNMLFAAVYCLRWPEQDWVVDPAISGCGDLWVWVVMGQEG